MATITKSDISFYSYKAKVEQHRSMWKDERFSSFDEAIYWLELLIKVCLKRDCFMGPFLEKIFSQYICI